MQRLLLVKISGGEGMNTLAPSVTWDEEMEGRVEVSNGSREYNEVSDHFMAALYSQREQITVREQVERIRNIPLWQTYAVKKQTRKTRYHEKKQRTTKTRYQESPQNFFVNNET